MDMTQLFTKYSVSMDVLKVDFHRDWDYLSMIYAMKNVYVAAYGIGGLSNGAAFGLLEGECALIPDSVILGKNI